MKFLRILLKLFLFSSLLMAIFLAAITVYMKFYGNAHITKALSALVGSQVEFKSVALNFSKQAATFKGVSVASSMGFDKDIFDADIFTIVLNKEKLEKEKKIVFDSVYVKGAKLNIIRNARGVFNIVLPTHAMARLDEPAFGLESVAHAAEAPAAGLYELLKNVRSVRIEESSVTFEDNYRMSRPYRIWCDNLYADISARDSGAGYISVGMTVGLRLPQKQGGAGWLGAKGGVAVYPDNMNMEVVIESGNVDLRLFEPYFQMYTPFRFQSGRFSSKTDFRMHGGAVNSLTTMYFNNLALMINAYAPNAQFLNVSINRLAPYLRSGSSLVFDFTMSGDARNPEFGVGPRVKTAISMVVMEEVGKAVIQQMQR